MISSQFSNVLRVTELDSGASNIRQIAVSTVLVNLILDTGTYWLDWQSTGSGSIDVLNKFSLAIILILTLFSAQKFLQINGHRKN